MDADRLLSARLRAELGPALEPLTLSVEARRRIRSALIPQTPPVSLPAPAGVRRRDRPAAETRPRFLGGLAGRLALRPAWGAVGVAAVVAVALAVILVPRPGPAPRGAAGALRSPQRVAAIPAPGKTRAGPPQGRAVVTPARPRPALAGGRAAAPSLCRDHAPAARLTAPGPAPVPAGRPLALAVTEIGGCGAALRPTATVRGPGLAPAPLAVVAGSAAPAAHAALAPAAVGRRFVVRWTGRLRSGRPLPDGRYRVTVRLPGTTAAVVIPVTVATAA